MVPNFRCSREVAAAELHLCFVIKFNVKRNLLPMVTVVVLHYKHKKVFKPFTGPYPALDTWRGEEFSGSDAKFLNYVQ